MVESELILLKPYIKSSLTDTIYSMKKDGQLKIHTNDESINYYFVRDGSAEMIFDSSKIQRQF